MTQDERSMEPVSTVKHALVAVTRIVSAARRLYFAGTWTTPGLPPAEQADLWMELRDALGLPPGTATAAAAGSRSYVCKRCGLDEIQAKANGCSSVPCPMALKPNREPITRECVQCKLLWTAPVMECPNCRNPSTPFYQKTTTLSEITETPAPIPEFAIGTNKYPPVIDLHDGKYMVQLGLVVSEAFKLSGYHIKAWNAISQDSRDIYIERVIRRMRGDAERGRLPV